MIKRALWLLLVPLGIVLYIGFYLPIYADETVWKLYSSRFLLDSGQAINLHPQCSKSLTRPYPLAFYPARIVNALLWGELSSLWKMRLGGLIQFVFWCVSFCLINLAIQNRNGPRKKDQFVLISSFCLFGVLPLGMMLNRPEQPLLLAFNLIVLAPFLSFDGAKKSMGPVIYTVGILFFLSEHAKGLFFLPACVIALLFLKISKRNKFFFGGFLSLCALACYQFYMGGVSCSENEIMRKTFQAQMVSPTQLVTSPGEALKQMATNFKNSTSYLYNILFAEGYISDWLPPMGKLSFPIRLLNLFLKMMILLWTGVVVFLWLQPVFKRDWKQLKTLPWLLVSTIFIGLFCLMIFQTAKNAYESQFFLPILFVAGTLMVSQKEPSKKRAKINEYFTVVVILLAVISSLVLLSKLQPYIKGEWVQGGPVPSQPYSVSAFKFDEVVRDVNELSAQCGISKDKSLKHLVVDDITYTQFWNTQEPFLSTVFSNWGDKDAQLIQFLRDKQVPGIIVRCDWMPESLKKQASRKGKLCCHPSL